jgi:hypothetical protein
MRKRPDIFLTAFLAVALGFTLFLSGCAKTEGDLTAEMSDATSEQRDDSYIVSESERDRPEGTIEVIYPKYLMDASFSTPEETQEEGSPYAETLYANEDGTMTLYSTPEELQQFRQDNVDNLQKQVDRSAQEDIRIEVSDDYREVTLYVGPDATADAVNYGMYRASVCASVIQICDTYGKNFSISVSAVDETTGEEKEHYDQDSYLDYQSDLSWVGKGGE